MGKGEIDLVAHLGLDETLGDEFRRKYRRDPEELVKNVPSDAREELVRKVFAYMLKDSTDEANPEEYSDGQREVIEKVQSAYDPLKSPENGWNILYETTRENMAFMQFDELLSKYSDAFHRENFEKGPEGLKEIIAQDHIYLKATRQVTGGRD